MYGDCWQRACLTAISLITLLIAGCNPSGGPNGANSDAAAAISVTDYTGNTVSLPHPAERIIALSPHIVENVFAAGAGDKLVGVVDYSDYPAAAGELPVVGSFATINHERIIELEPDLIIAWKSGNSQAGVQRLKELGFPVYLDEPKQLEDIAKSLHDIGELSGTVEHAAEASNQYLSGIQKMRHQNQGKRVLRSFYQVWNQPLQTVNGTHLISQAIKLCGGSNIFADEHALAPTVNIEAVLQRDPEVIIASGASTGKPDWLEEWRRWPSLSAVKLDNLLFVRPDHIQRHTARLLQGIETLCTQMDQARGQ